MMTQVSAPTPTKDPLTTQDRQIIATIVNQSDYSKECQPEDVVTIWINSDDIVLGILFKVRNAEEVWENDPKTYYWRCGDGVRYWSVKEAVEALSRVTAPIELPQLRRELIAA